MGYEIVLQWSAIIFTIFVLVWTNQGKSTGEKKAGISFLVMNLLINIGYLFELMADSGSAAFLSIQIEYAGLIFMGYFMCMFFSYYVKSYVQRWVAVYTLIFDLIMLMIVWTSNWHELIFKNVSYNLTEVGYELSFEYGELYFFVVLGCVVVPFVLSLMLIISYIGREWVARLRRQIVLMAALLFSSFALMILFFAQSLPLHYNVAGPLGMVFADWFTLRFWGREGFHPQTASSKMAFDNLNEGVLILDGAMRLMFYNPAAKEIFPELEPTSLHHNMKRLHSVPLELFEEYEKKEIQLGTRHYEVTRSKVPDVRGEIRGYVMIFRDRTMEYNYIAEIENGRKKTEVAEQEALHALGEAKRANRIKADFLTNISHEIRTPMNAIVGLAELIIEESRGRKVYDFACDIKNASTNLLAVISDILSLSKLEAGQMTLEQEEYSTEQLLEETLHLAKLTASSRGLQLKRDISPQLPCKLVGDQMRIRQMINNFLDFGMQGTKRGYVKLTVTHKWLNEKQALMIFQFEDTGDGYTKEETEGLFDKFQRMDDTKERNLESIGLGIAITKRFVDLMDGTVEITSEPGKGTTFTVCFPQKVADVRSIEQQPWRKHDVIADIDRAFVVPDYRVLVVDDNKINLKVACGALEPYKFLVDEAKSGRQAIDLVKNHVYDLILMDHMMPEMDGIETTDHIRNDCGENGKKPIVIALSANAYNNAREMFLNSGFQDFISKPLDKNELHKTLCKWIPQERRQPVEGTQEAQEKIERASMAEIFMTGIDVNAVMGKHTGGMEDYLELLELYYMDGAEKSGLLEQLVHDEDFKNYEIEVHGLKSASANIGAYDFSELAKSHEFAAKEGDYQMIRDGLPKLLSEYNFLLHEIERVLKSKGYLKEEDPANDTDESACMPLEETYRRMAEILDDIENFRSKPAAQKTEELLSENIEKSAKDCLKDIRNRLKMYDDDTAEDLLRAFLEGKE